MPVEDFELTGRFVKSDNCGYAAFTDTVEWPNHLIQDIEGIPLTSFLLFPGEIHCRSGSINDGFQGLHVFSVEDNTFYYYAGSPDIQVSALYKLPIKWREREFIVNKCGYIVINETSTFFHKDIVKIESQEFDLTRYPQKLGTPKCARLKDKDNPTPSNEYNIGIQQGELFTANNHIWHYFDTDLSKTKIKVFYQPKPIDKLYA
ncbi:MAG: hypothetical protein VKL42_08970 [Snowella sp.]|nr:hypothetical protein [Snowella sp.]